MFHGCRTNLQSRRHGCIWQGCVDRAVHFESVAHWLEAGAFQKVGDVRLDLCKRTAADELWGLCRVGFGDFSDVGFVIGQYRAADALMPPGGQQGSVGTVHVGAIDLAPPVCLTEADQFAINFDEDHVLVGVTVDQMLVLIIRFFWSLRPIQAIVLPAGVLHGCNLVMIFLATITPEG